MLHILESQIQHHFKFDFQILFQTMILGKRLKSHYKLQHAQGMTLKSGYILWKIVEFQDHKQK
jgi:hypothetical protein